MKSLKYIIPILIVITVSGCVQNTHPKSITVILDVNSLENPSKVGIRGTSPLSWDETTFLTDVDGDGIYEDTFEINTASNTIEFKFVNNSDEFELQDQNNRHITFEYKPESIVYKAIFNNANDIKITRQ